MDEPITLCDLLSELSLGQKVWLLAKIYWRKAVGLARQFGELVVRVLDFPLDKYWHRPISPSLIMAEELGKDYKPRREYIELGYTAERQKDGSYHYLPPSFTISIPTDTEGKVIPSLYEFNAADSSPRKNEPHEREEWENRIQTLLNIQADGFAELNGIILKEELDFWFSQDYTPHAVAEMVLERRSRQRYTQPTSSYASLPMTFSASYNSGTWNKYLIESHNNESFWINAK